MFRTFWKIITFQWVLSAFRLKGVADDMWNTPEAIRMGFAKRKGKMLEFLKQLETNFAAANGLVKRNVKEITDLEEEKKTLQPRLDEIVRQATVAKESGDTTKTAELEALFASVDKRLQEIDARQVKLASDLKANRERAEKQKARYLDFQAQIQHLDRREQDTINDFISANMELQFSDNAADFNLDDENDPVNIITRNVTKLTEKADARRELGGAQLKDTLAQLDASAREHQSSSRLAQMVAARQAQTAQATGTGTETPTPAAVAEGDRTKI